MSEDQPYRISLGAASESPDDLQLLLAAYIELNQLHAQPGEKCHMLSTSIQFIERMIRNLMRGDSSKAPSVATATKEGGT